jgi:type IV pilus assembly protein PilP
MKAVMAYPFAIVVLALSGCVGSSNEDLEAYINETIAKPAGEIEPIPTFQPYKVYKYANLALRSPFEPPRPADVPEDVGKIVPPPDETRPKEFLEGIPFSSLAMVGTLEQDGVVWGLINDGAGGIHRITTGNFLGKNFGKIVTLTPSQLDVIEIVPDGKGGWLERPRTLTVKGN